MQLRGTGSTTDLAEDLTVRPAASLDVDVHCKGVCPAPLRISLGPMNWQPGTHVARLPAGTHPAEVIAGFGQPDEQRAVPVVSVTFAGGAQHVSLTLAPDGGGKDDPRHGADR